MKSQPMGVGSFIIFVVVTLGVSMWSDKMEVIDAMILAAIATLLCHKIGNAYEAWRWKRILGDNANAQDKSDP